MGVIWITYQDLVSNREVSEDIALNQLRRLRKSGIGCIGWKYGIAEMH
jgi:hypothetical protein